MLPGGAVCKKRLKVLSVWGKSRNFASALGIGLPRLLLLTNYKNVRLMNQYETVFILTPVLSEEQMKEAVGKFRNYLTERGAEILYENNWGMRKLAYNIGKKSSGFYVEFGFKAEPTLISKLEINYRRDERVLRFLTVKMDKNAAAYAAKRQSLKNKED